VYRAYTVTPPEPSCLLKGLVPTMAYVPKPRPIPEVEVAHQRALSEAMARRSTDNPDEMRDRPVQSGYGRWLLLLGVLGVVIVILLIWAFGIL
jgi:hypothetical protein